MPRLGKVVLCLCLLASAAHALPIISSAIVSYGDNTLLIPNKAIVDQLGESFVFVTYQDKRVIQRKVTLGKRIGDKIVVSSGLEQGEKVVIDGVQKLKDSSAIMIGAPKPAPAAK